MATVPARTERLLIDTESLTFRNRAARVDPAPSYRLPQRTGWRPVVRSWLDWETVTPIDALSTRGPRARLKKALRAWRDRARRASTEAP